MKVGELDARFSSRMRLIGQNGAKYCSCWISSHPSLLSFPSPPLLQIFLFNHALILFYRQIKLNRLCHENNHFNFWFTSKTFAGIALWQRLKYCNFISYLIQPVNCAGECLTVLQLFGASGILSSMLSVPRQPFNLLFLHFSHFCLSQSVFKRLKNDPWCHMFIM